MLMQYKVRGYAGEHWLQGEEDGCVGGGEMLLRPALDGERSGRGEETGYGESDEEAWSER